MHFRVPCLLGIALFYGVLGPQCQEGGLGGDRKRKLNYRSGDGKQPLADWSCIETAAKQEVRGRLGGRSQKNGERFLRFRAPWGGGNGVKSNENH